MIKLYDIILTGGLFGAAIISFILIFKKSINVYCSRLLASTLVLLSLYFLVYELFVTRLILQFPLVYSFAIPFYYLIPPLCFLYVRGKVKAETSFKPADLLHLLPAFLAFAELLPFYSSPYQHKIDHISLLLSDIRMAHLAPMGLIPASAHFLLRPLQAFVYLILQTLVLIKYKRDKKEAKLARPIQLWMASLTFFLTAIYSAMLTATLDVSNYIESGQNFAMVDTSLLFVVSFSFLAIIVHLFFRPEIVYGISPAQKTQQAEALADREATDSKQPKAESEEGTAAEEKEEFALDPRVLLQYIRAIEDNIEQQELFREKKLTITILAAKLDIPPRTLSYILNQQYQQRFTDFINRYRVNYIISRFLDDNWRDITLEALAAEAGFSSRSTFFAAFKKFTGMSPSDYQQQVSDKSIA